MTRRAASFAAAALFLSAAPLSGRTRQSNAGAVEAATLLKPGASVERSLDAAERHTYEVALGDAECAALTVDQKGVDVVIRVLDASGTVVSAIDDETRKDGREHVTLVADRSGTYRFTISARYSKHDPGSYAVWIDGIHPATDRDRALAEARRLRTELSSLRTAGKLDDGLEQAMRAVKLAETALDPQDALVGALLGELATLQRAKGQQRESEQSYLRAIDISQAALGRDNPQTAFLIQMLGDLYNSMEDHAKAEPLLLEGAATTERILGEHPRVAISLMDEAVLHTNRGDYDRARRELERAQAIAERTLPADDLTAIGILNNLGDLYITLKDYDRAQPYVEQAMARLERSVGPDNYRISSPLFSLAIIVREKGDYPRALQYLRRAYDIRAKAYGVEHTLTAAVLITIGNVYHAQGDYRAALETYQRAYDVLERTAGPYHSFTMMAISNAARTYAAAGNVNAALEYQSKFDARVEKTIDFNLAIGSEREKLTYLEGTFEKMGRTITLNLTQLPQSAAAADLAASAILRRKGRVLDALSDTREALRGRLDAGDRTLLDDYATVTTKLSRLALSGPGRTPSPAFGKQLDDLEKQRESLESRMSSRSAQFRAERQGVSIARVRAALPSAAALVEFVAYEPFHPGASSDKDQHEAPHYAAYVIRREADTTGVDLGPVKEIDGAVARLREALRDPSRTDVTRLARRLDELVLRPVRARIGTAGQLLIAPDGALNLVPFEALVDEQGRFQVERYAVSYFGSGRDVLRLQVQRGAAGPPVVLADPAFGEPPLASSTGAGVRKASVTPDNSPVYFAPLDGTKQEAAAIGRLMPGAIVLTGSRATKSALTQVAAPSILHIASHAFFLPDGGAATHPAVENTRSMTATVQSSNPLLRSGIALAGANLSRPGDAGILTAMEASTLNLWGTYLVTLSACDTGVGDVKTGEGVYGLRRAFLVAGAESLVMSLWPVSDQVTRTVMTRYYAGLARGEGRSAALRRVQIAMLASKNRRHPFYWAGFIQAGDWTPIPKIR